MPTFKTKMSKSSWLLLGIAVLVPFILIVLHIVGVIDLSFISNGFIGVLIWASESLLNGVLFTGGVFVGGMLTWYALKKYIIGTEIPVAGAYAPIGQTITPTQQKDEETVVTS